MIALIEITPWHWAVSSCSSFLRAGPRRVSPPPARRQIPGGPGVERPLGCAGAGCSPASLVHWRGTRGRRGLHHRLRHRTFAVARQHPRHRAHLCRVSACRRNISTAAVLGHPRRAGDARRDDRASGAALIQSFNWVLYVFGAFLVFTGAKMFFAGRCRAEPEKNSGHPARAETFSRRSSAARTKFTDRNGTGASPSRRCAGAAAGGNDRSDFCRGFHAGDFCRDAQSLHRFHLECLCHSRPALAVFPARLGAIDYFRYFKAGLSVVLVFVGAKMLLDPHDHEPQMVPDRDSHWRFAARLSRYF